MLGGTAVADVDTSIRYINPEWKDRDEVPAIGSRESRRANTAYREVTVRDVRLASEDFDLESAGFQLLSDCTPFDATADDRSHYHQSVLDLVQKVSGASRTVLLADLVRTEDQSDFNTAYARFVHCDYNLASTNGMARDLLRRRAIDVDPAWTFVWYNTWQPFDWAAVQHPLAMLDVRSLHDGDIIDYRYTGYQGGTSYEASTEGQARGARVAAPVYSPEHRWWYYSEMSTSDVLLSKQGDHRAGHTAQCPHTSFVDPQQPANAPPRRSIEVRILALIDPSSQETA